MPFDEPNALTVGQHAGFCFGVRRAVDQAYACARQGLPCVTLGPLIHNPQEVARLAQSGIRSVESLDAVREGQTVLIRSHGVTQQVYAQCAARGLQVIDATCPHVAHIHRLVDEYSRDGSAVIIVGEADHPEVIGIAGWTHGDVYILPTVLAVQAAKALPARAMVVAQTTIRRDRFDEVVQALSRRIADLQVRMTICAATSRRQQEAETLSENADVMVVVGGRNSSNTQKLLETCRLRCPRALLAETPEDVPDGLAKPGERVCVTAGASTPQWLLDAVCERIRANIR